MKGPQRMFLLLVSVLLGSVSSQLCSVYPTTNYTLPATFKTDLYRIGGFTSISPAIFSALNLALNMLANDTNHNPNLLPNVRLEVYMANDNYVNGNALLAVETLHKLGVRGLIGSGIIAETRIGAIVSGIAGIPQLTPFTMSTEFSNKNVYPYLARAICPDQIEAQAFVALLQAHGWKQVLFVYSSDDSGSNSFQQFTAAVKHTNITAYPLQFPTGAANFTTTIKAMHQMIEQYRLRVFIYVSQYTDALILFPQLNQAGIIGNPKYANIMSFSMSAAMQSYPINTVPFALGMMGILPETAVGPVYNSVVARWNTRSSEPGWYPFITSLQYFYDSMLTLIYSLDNVMKSGVPYANVTGAMQMKAISGLSFMGTTGNVTYDSVYNRIGNMNIFNYGLNATQNLIPVAKYYSNTGNFTQFSPIIFANGTTKVYDGICPCVYGTCDDEDQCICSPGYIGERCDQRQSSSSSLSTTTLAIIIVIPILLVIVVIISAYKYMQYKRARIIKDVSDRQRSNILREDISLINMIGRGASGVVYKGMFRGTEVAVKKMLTENMAKDVVEEFELESAVMAGLRHPNIVMFMGSCFLPKEKEMFIVMEYMERGSLYDVIYNPKANLTLELAWHIALQAAKGMNFLHQSNPPIIHRDLKSHNILLDEKWNARIADFGITRIKETKSKKTEHTNDIAGTIYWTAPEIFEGRPATEKSDCYAFGIVLWELCHRKLPYNGREPMAVALEVSRSGLRPTIDANCDHSWRELMQACWAQDPAARPTFQEVMQRLRIMSTKYSAVKFLSETKEVEAPSGAAYFVYTDVVGGNTLWDFAPEEMQAALALHNATMRAGLDTHEGYEVTFEGNGFLLAFEDLANAMNWCISTQIALMRVDWPARLLNHNTAAPELTPTGDMMQNGLRVRMSVHYGIPNSSLDSLSGRITYDGPTIDRVKKALRMPSNAAVVATETIMDHINSKNPQLAEPITHKQMALLHSSPRSKQERLYEITCTSLRERSSLANSLSTSLPHSIMDIEGDELTPGNDEEGPSWLINYNALVVKENIGKGAVADYYHALWSGKEVAVKSLINQKLDEHEFLTFKARIAIISKLHHKNVINTFGACFDADHLSVITEYLPNQNLREILSSGENITLLTKMKIARGIAEGMSFVTSHDNRAISYHSNLKSCNVMVNLARGGEVKLTDIGQGNLKDAARTMTSVASVAWTAPEIILGEEVDSSVATYSFGIVLYEIYTNKVPYAGEHPIKLVAKIIDGYRPALPADCPPALGHLITKCWSAHPRSRPSWSTIIQELNMLISSLN